jgi:dolichol-phosphate mannosyltransferase
MSGTRLLNRIAIIPVYRDLRSILDVLAKFEAAFADEICIVIDCGREEELREIETAAQKIETPVHLIFNGERKGVGHALKEGIVYALKKNYDIAIIMAGNNKDNPREIPRLVNPILKKGFDYVQGSRFLPGGRPVKNPFLRGMFSRFYPFFWTWSTRVRCTDVTNGFRAYRLKIFNDERINIWQNWLDSYELEYYIHYKVLTLGYKMTEVPVSKIYSHRHKGGYSNISPLKDWWKIVGPLVYLKLGIKD